MKNLLQRDQVLLLIAIIVTIGAIGVAALKPSEASVARVNVKTVTYNVLGAGALAAPTFNKNHGTTNQARTEDAAKVIKDMSAGVVGFQELDNYKVNSTYSQYTWLKMQLPGYGFYPNEIRTSDRANTRAIAWKREKFTVINQGIIKYPWQNAPKISAGNFENNDGAPWVLLRSKTNTSISFYVLNIHLIARNYDCRYTCNPPGTPGGSDRGGAEKRMAAAKIVKRWVNNHRDQPVIVLGDFNATFGLRSPNDDWLQGSRTNLPYCILTSDNLLDHVDDRASGRNGHCPRKTNGTIDHIFITNGINLSSGPTKYSEAPAGRASDHKPYVSTVAIP